MTTFLSAFRTVHSRSLAFAAALPLVAAIPLVAEFVQHVVEIRSGMYAGVEAAQALESDPDRMIAGFFKTVALGLPAYFLIRWLHTQGDRAFATRFDRPAVTLFGLVIALQALLAWLGLYVWTEGPMGIGFFVFGLIFMPLIVRFIAAGQLHQSAAVDPRDGARRAVRDPFPAGRHAPADGAALCAGHRRNLR